MSSMLQEYEEYDQLKDTTEGRAILAEACPSAAYKPLPAATIAPSMRTELLPPVLRSMAEAIAANQNVPVDLPALVGLGVASACACGRIGVQLKPGWYEPAQLFLFGVLDSGEGKTPVFKAMTRALFQTQAEENKQRAVQIEADKAELDVLQARKSEAVKKKQPLRRPVIPGGCAPDVERKCLFGTIKRFNNLNKINFLIS